MGYDKPGPTKVTAEIWEQGENATKEVWWGKKHKQSDLPLYFVVKMSMMWVKIALQTYSKFCRSKLNKEVGL